MSLKSHRILLVAAALTVLPLTLSGCSIVATPVAQPTNPTSQPTAEPIEPEKPSNEPVDPGGNFTTISDDSGIVSVNVPTDWTDASGTQLTSSDGIVYYNVTASTDLAAWQGGWTVPGVSVSSTQDPGVVIDDLINGTATSVGADCDEPEIGDYDDGVYVGKYVYLANCGGTTTDYVSVVANDVDGTHTIICSIQMVTDEDKSTVRDEILKSFWAIYP
jgi:serine protease Do